MNQTSKIDQLLSKAYAAHQARDLAQAEKLYRQVLRRNPQDSDAANLLGLLLIESRRFAEARQIIGKACRIQPNNPQSYYNLGIATLECGDSSDAKQQFARSVALAPQNPESLTALGNAQKICGDLEAAESSFRSALQYDQKSSAAQQGLSNVLNDHGALAVEAGDYTNAQERYGEAIALNPGNAKAALNQGMLLEQLGDEHAAEDSYLRAIRADPGFSDAHFQLAHLKVHNSSNTEIDAMKSLYADTGTTVNEKAMLAYGIGKALDKQAQHEQEFNWLTKAHKIMGELEEFDLGSTLAQFELLPNIFTQEVVSSNVNNIGSELVFVIGMPRSGTSLTEQILASHPDVYGAGELMSGLQVSRKISDHRGPTTGTTHVSDMPAERLASIAESMLSDMQKDAAGKAVIVDTTPSNFMHVGLLAMLFPQARFVLCVRHPLDTCLSIYQHPLSAAHAYAHDLDTLAGYFLGYQRLVDYWAEILPDRFYVQDYEKTVSNLETSVTSLLEFCNLEYDDACLNFHETQRIVKTPSASQVRQPIYASSVGRWKRYAEQLAPLARLLENELGTLLD